MTRTVFISHTDIQQMWSGLSSSTKRTAAYQREPPPAQQLHISQWTHLRTCMFLLDAEEQERAGTPFGLVLKLREDSLSLQPWPIPSS